MENQAKTDEVHVGVTGHRPGKIFGYDLNDPKRYALRNGFKQLLIDLKCTHAYTGMALGVDTDFALSVCALKKEGTDIKLICMLPCKDQSKVWPNPVDRKLHELILLNADEITGDDIIYTGPGVLQQRNIRLVNRVDIIIAVWDGSPGGTANCVRYAEKQHKRIIRVTPAYGRNTNE